MKAISLSNLSLAFLILTAPLISQQSKLSKSVNHISGYIASNKFENIKRNYNDLALVDSIFSQAVQFADRDYSEALLGLTFATIPYKKVPILFPVINVQAEYELISAKDSVFELKNKNLPKYLFYDSPENDYGDKDKLAHFFGNAFIRYSQNILDLSFLIGYFVESFEEDFKVDSEISYRDIDVNWYGDLFGDLLKQNENILPSNVLLLRSFRHLIFNL